MVVVRCYVKATGCVDPASWSTSLLEAGVSSATATWTIQQCQEQQLQQQYRRQQLMQHIDKDKGQHKDKGHHKDKGSDKGNKGKVAGEKSQKVLVIVVEEEEEEKEEEEEEEEEEEGGGVEEGRRHIEVADRACSVLAYSTN